MKKIQTMISALLMFVTIGSAQDSMRNSGNDQRQRIQRARIADGAVNGQLTRPERAALVSEQRQIRITERRVEADGVVTRREQARLTRKQNRANRHIRRAKNNNLEN
ncbi:MAG: hypothetical protein O2887_13885 [Bacteroidetes bacterium]|nr:hypothetical protein [Bacteroidota bacterium]MDA1121560.1 hypothetical protein [Bacteroidota bacterium]